ncbi:small integral membrane protein 6 [Perognathus longimembris pacificus]|uniref:small integral membrane protein 6 n=1 Tax=Perognathus longimembris pacificus TaxID=214514 RepID=UPI002018D8A8|nr:small integral membrane protein 6 [Perognathus longimembris pacificus]
MGQVLFYKDLWKEEFWENPWELGGLIVIGLFTVTFLFFILFAVLFGLLFPSEQTENEE